MPNYEYKVVPAPKKGQRGKGLRDTESRFAHALQLVMNEHGAEGWEYQRTDTLPCEERSGLTGKTNVFQNMLVFRRTRDVPVSAEATPVARPTPVPDQPPTPTAPSIETAHSAGRSDASALGGVTKTDPGQAAPVDDVSRP